jgi:uncharacterized protein (DUF1501 family)
MSRALSRRNFLRRFVISDDKIASVNHGNVLVCIFLRGGADTLNMLAPYGDEHYYKARPTLAIPKPKSTSTADGCLLDLDGFYGLHPKLSPLHSIFQEDRLAFVQAVGSDNTSGSHFDAQDQMEHGEAYLKPMGGGWLGRHLHHGGKSFDNNFSTPLSAVAIGSVIPESLRGAPGASALETLDDINLKGSAATCCALSKSLQHMYSAEIGILNQPGQSTLKLLDRVHTIGAKPYSPSNGAEYPKNFFGKGLKEIARLIKSEVGLEVACVDLGGWDTHFVQGSLTGIHADNLDYLAKGLAAFDKDLGHHHDRVTTVVMTEFGRRIYENGSLGTDHGRGFAMMLIGNRIRGGKVHGKYPGLEPTQTDILGPGGMTVCVDYRSVLAEVLASIMGNRNIDKVFPGFEPQPVGFVTSRITS